MFQIIGFYLGDSLNAMAEKMVGRCVTIKGKWLHNCFYIFDSHIYNSQESLLFCFYFSECLVFIFSFFLRICLHIGVSTIGLSLWLHFFIRKGSYAYS